jgi:uncharacterized delta-60 repeat protein
VYSTSDGLPVPGTSFVVQGDGKFIVAGLSASPATSFSLARFNPDGTPDSTFGTNGLASVNFAAGSVDRANAVALQADGKIVAAGRTSAVGGTHFGLTRFNTNGTVDTTFGQNGFVVINFGTTNDEANGVAVQADGRIVVAGTSTVTGFPQSYMSVARCYSDGMQDSDFNANGKLQLNYGIQQGMPGVGPSTDVVTGLALQSDGQILVSGYTNLASTKDHLGPNNIAVVRFNALNGTLDTSFGTSGLLNLDLQRALVGTPTDGSNDIADRMILQPDGKILLGVITENVSGLNNFAMVRLNTNASLDNTLSLQGYVGTDFATDFRPGVLDQTNGVAVQADGKIILTGFSTRLGNRAFAVARYDPNGTLDQSFGLHGEVVTNFPGSTSDIASNVFIQADGKIVVLGTTNSGNGPHFALARYSGLQAGVLQFSAATYSVPENGGSITITVNRVNGTDNTITVNYATSDGTAVAGTDYVAASGTLTFNPGVTSQTFTVTVKDDNIFQTTNKAFNLLLSNPTSGGGLGGPTTAVVTLVETDQAGVLQFNAPTFTVAKTAGSATITVVRNSGSAGTVTVNYATSDGTAVAGTDYTATSGTLSFGPGETSKTFTVPIINDGVYQPVSKSFNLTLSNSTGGATLGAQSTAVVTITQTGATGNQLFIAQVYLDLLGRPVDPAGLAGWTAFLNAGNTHQQMVLALETSQEYRTVVVQALYSQYLHRPADAMGLGAFTAQLAAGATQEQVAAEIVGSPEYFQNRGGGTNAGFLAALYQDALNRPIDATGLAGFSQAMSNGMTPGQVAAAIFSSTEYLQDLVGSYYLRFLRRPADTAGLNFFVSLLQPTHSSQQPIFVGDPNSRNRPPRDEDVIAMIIGSPEYSMRLTG